MNALRGYPVSLIIFWILITHYSLLFLSGCATQAKVQRLKEASAHYKLGISYLNDQQNQQAFVEFQKAVELNPNDRDSYYALGHIYVGQLKYDEAEQAFKKTLKIDSDYSEAHNYLGKVYEQRSALYEQRGESNKARRELDKAIHEYQKALANPTYATPDIAHYNLGLIFQRKGQFDAAVGAYQKAIQINPDHLLAQYALAQLYADRGRFQEAVASYKEVLRLFPDSAEARYKLAWVYLKSNARTEAVSEFSTLVQRLPDSELAKRSRKQLSFLESKAEKLRPGMTSDQVMRVLGKSGTVVRNSGSKAGQEQWLLDHYDLVLLFEDGRYTGYQESPRK
jgi:type IV pilus biogenesis/stability protein PilW